MKKIEIVGIVIMLILFNLFIFWIVKNLETVIPPMEITWFAGLATGSSIVLAVKEYEQVMLLRQNEENNK